MAICGDGCTAPSQYYVGDEGTEIIVDTCSDISAATVTDLIVRKPDGTQVTWSGAIYDTTKIRYVTTTGDFDQAGRYRLQAYVEMPGWKGFGETTTFKVLAAFQ
jgi:hypothetical protein